MNILYTSPTALRAIRQKGDKWIEDHDLSTLRLLGSVGEPIDPDTWEWFFEKVGGGRCPVVDTYWQTETGGILLTSLPGIGPFVPGVAGPALPGITYDVLDATGEPIEPNESGKVVQEHPFGIGMLRGIYEADQNTGPNTGANRRRDLLLWRWWEENGYRNRWTETHRNYWKD